MKRIISGLAATATLAAALTLGVTATAQADGYIYMKPAELQHTVLRAQMPKSLGSWTQYYYYSESSKSFTVPTLCWNSKGAVTLPASKVVGGVGYQIDPNTSGSVTVFQYADAAKAQAALAALQKAGCSDNPKIADEGGTLVPAESGSDFTDDSRTGYAAGVSYTDGDVQVFKDVRTTQRGLAIVQTEVFRAVDDTVSTKQAQQIASRLGSVNGTWHAAAVKAYESFGQGRAR